jgi:glutamate formiminotransferase/formiminotetrahydrofolate cyclodeaminase
MVLASQFPGTNAGIIAHINWEMCMSKSLVECVPNFSEARRPEVVEDIVNTIAAVPSVVVLDQHSDIDHNRTVVTFVGTPNAVQEAAFRAISKAAELIDLNQHNGEHPRIGATDVVPFIPISGVEMQDCVEIAEQLGNRVGKELGIPVYLYEQAARSPDRQNLEWIRRGEYETLKSEIGTNPDRAPDYGPPKLGSAGATVIGARHFLIAYNVYLTTDDVSIAKKVARSVRHSSGGLRYVKAIGLLVEGRAQVSMNLTNFRKTPISSVVEMIRSEAGRYGVGIHHSELVGLIPQEALEDAAIWYTQMDQFDQEQVLERRLYVAQETGGSMESEIETSSLSDHFLEVLASGEPTPGGGSAAAYSAAAGAALVEMVARLTVGRKKYVNVEVEMKSALQRAEALRSDLTTAVARDADAFNAVLAAFRLPKSTNGEIEHRKRAIEEATLEATRVPFTVAEKALEVMEIAVLVTSKGNINAMTDAGTGAMLAHAGIKGAGLNVRVNICDLKDKALADSMLESIIKIEENAIGIEKEIWSIISERGK